MTPTLENVSYDDGLLSIMLVGARYTPVVPPRRGLLTMGWTVLWLRQAQQDK